MDVRVLSSGAEPLGWEVWGQLLCGVAQANEAGYVQKVNRALEDVLGRPAAELIGKPLTEAIPGLTWPLPDAVCLLTWPAGTVLAVQLAHRDEALLVAVVPLSDLPGLVLSVAEAKAEQAELETVLEASFDEIFIIDGEGRVVRVNAACERYYGLPASALEGRTVEELQRQGLFTPASSPEVLATGQRHTVVQETRTGRRLITTSSPVFGPGGEIHRIVAVARDVTELNHLAEQLHETEVLADRYRRELQRLQTRLRPDDSVPIYDSPAMRDIIDLVQRVAAVDAAVLIMGESGVGKGQIAHLLHKWGRKADRPFQTIDCGALPASLIESELFGYEAGTFTGGNKEGKEGLIESAHGGTLFLDEIGELPLPLQVKLLRFLQEKTVTRVGGRQVRQVDVRVVAATNRDLWAMVKAGEFREDLFWRLNVLPIVLPPLRERVEDIPVLLNHFLETASTKYGRQRSLSQAALTVLSQYSWPGNVRELENLVVRLVVTSRAPVIDLNDLPQHLVAGDMEPGEVPVRVVGLVPLRAAQEELERQLLSLARQQGRSTREMAALLGVNQSTIVRKMRVLFPAEPWADD